MGIKIGDLPPTASPSRDAAVPVEHDGLTVRYSVAQILQLILAGDVPALAAATLSYDNGVSGLTADDVQAAIDEVAAMFAELGTAAAVDTGTAAGQIPLLGTGGKLDRACLPSGAVINTVVAACTSAAGVTAQIAYDETIPQNTKGTQVVSASITPTDAGSILRATFIGWAAPAANTNIITGLFRNGVADALNVAIVVANGTNVPAPLVVSAEYAPGTTDAQTISVRVGPDNPTTVYLNGNSVGRRFGGASKAVLLVEEIRG